MTTDISKFAPLIQSLQVDDSVKQDLLNRISDPSLSQDAISKILSDFTQGQVGLIDKDFQAESGLIDKEAEDEIALAEKEYNATMKELEDESAKVQKEFESDLATPEN